MPQLPTDGRTATTNTMTPIPPSHWVTERQKSRPTEALKTVGSAPSGAACSTVAPVVVKPETDSNRAMSRPVMAPVAR